MINEAGKHGVAAAITACLALASPAAAQTAAAPLATETGAAAAAVEAADELHRPEPPPLPDISGVAANFDCANAMAAMKERDRQRISTFLFRFNALGRHTVRLSRWYAERFVAAGAWTSDEAEQFLANLSAHPEMVEANSGSDDLMVAMLGDLDQIATAEAAGRFPEACAILTTMLERLHEVPQRIVGQWAAIDRIYAAEAAREGITLPR